MYIFVRLPGQHSNPGKAMCVKRSEVDVAVIGGGGAGLVAAAGCAMFGAQTILVERNRFGGECTWTGCVPSKALLHAARRAHDLRGGSAPGIQAGQIDIDFAAVMDHVRATRRAIYDKGESPDHLRSLGIIPLKASARFLDAHRLLIERDGIQREVRFRSAIIATGSRPFVPEIPGADAGDFLTTDEIFEVHTRPNRLVVLGGGAVGVELAQAFSRLGSQVTIVHRDGHLLADVDAELSAVLQSRFDTESIETRAYSTVDNVSRKDGELRIVLGGQGQTSAIRTDQLFIATGRVPNTSSLDLDAAGVHYDRRGIAVDDYCRTNQRHIFAVGDVTPAPNLTHVGENMAKAASVNALARIPVWKFEQAVVPRAVFTDPEVATVGASTQELVKAGQRFDQIDFPFEKIDRSAIEDSRDGMIRINHHHGKILGATIVGPNAGEMIAEYALAMRHGLRLHDLASTVHAYPTMMLGTRRAADQIYVRALRTWMVRGFRSLYGYRGSIPGYVGTKSIL